MGDKWNLYDPTIILGLRDLSYVSQMRWHEDSRFLGYCPWKIKNQGITQVPKEQETSGRCGGFKETKSIRGSQLIHDG